MKIYIYKDEKGKIIESKKKLKGYKLVGVIYKAIITKEDGNQKSIYV